MSQHIAITGFLKATPSMEGDTRIVYIEASNEHRDFQNEIVLAKALQESAAYFLKYGNLDLDHITQIGLKEEIPDYHFYEIGQPRDVRISDKSTFVKGEIYRGEGQSAQRANEYWTSLTEQKPPQRWYPSIGGDVLAHKPVTDKSGATRAISRVLWKNIGFSKTPVNFGVAPVSTIPIGTFTKCWTPDGLDFAKALEAGYGTDSAALQGGGALRKQSLDGAVASYWDFRERISADITGKKLKNPDSKSLVPWAVRHYGLSSSLASEWVERFMADLSHSMKQRSKQ